MKLPFMAKKPNIEPEDLKSLEKIAVNKEWYEKSSSTSFVNLPLASRIFEKLAGDSPVSIFGLYANHSEQYQKLWGKCSFAYPGEYYARAWVRRPLPCLLARWIRTCFSFPPAPSAIR